MTALFGGGAKEPRYDPDNPPVTRPVEIFEALELHGVDYMTIGGFAAQIHGSQRVTLDIDIVVDRAKDNLDRLSRALADLEAEMRGVDAHLSDVDPTNARDLYAGANFTLITRAGPLDVFTDTAELPGSKSYESMRERRLSPRVGGVTMQVVGADDLIRLKEQASRLEHRPELKRAGDLADIAAITGQSREPGSTSTRRERDDG